MILFEYEGKKLLADAGIRVPNGQIVNSVDDRLSIKFPVVLKAQVLSGKRADAGGIIVCDEISASEGGADYFKFLISKLLGKIINNEKVEKVLVEEKVSIKKEFYISLSYDTTFRQPVLTFSESGGTGIEERKSEIIPINILNPLAGLTTPFDESLLKKLIDLFLTSDATLVEINPLVLTEKGEWFALDAKVNLDDTALGRHPDWKEYPPRSVAGYSPTKNEIEAKKIDEEDYRGTAGSTYFDFDGDIAILASGGGASITAMDALIAVGGKAANFTEYSGNPPREKVEKLTKIVLSKPNLHALWIVGALANFTDIYETLSGIIDGLRHAQAELGTKFNFPIVIRRAGPRDNEAFEMLKKVKDLDLHVYGEDTSIPESAKIIADLAREYANKIFN